ncbi:MAG: type VI secretion system baseplate subunit TssE [Pseudomonadota bacterium]|nr:type VI secretion system baseplate subunit TssE [Pseudomonadota bacterium]
MDKASFLPGIWDRLMAAGHSPARQSLAQLHAAIARDLEDLFNTRLALPADTLDKFSACRQTILNFGLMDFAALCLGSSEDQRIICAYVTETITRFEPRLEDIFTAIAPAIDSTNRLDVVIHATIKSHGAGPRVQFNAMLQPSTLQYAVRQATGRTT